VYDTLQWSRRLVKATVARTLGPFLPADGFLVVGYHRVVERFEWEATLSMPANLVSRGMLERHLDWIGRHHEFVSLDELGRRLANGGRSPRPLAAVTFDDGYRDVYENAFPMLMREGIPGAIFLVTSLIGTSDLQMHDKLYALIRKAISVWTRPKETLRRRLAAADVPEACRIRVPDTTDPFTLTRLLLTSLSSHALWQVIGLLSEELGTETLVPAGFLPLSWEMVAEMHRAGITMGSHTSNHVLLTNESRPRVYEEVTDSRRELERHLGAPVMHFAYPDGRFNRTAIKAVRQAGYQFGYTTCEHKDGGHPLLTIPRRVLWEHSTVDTRGRFVPALMRCQEHGLLLGSRACSWQSHA
jgi:peptidoglycan/xylan/chitin deacetylase (PgdA/CDA1 family)